LDGQLIRVPIPELNSERREELCKVASKYAENARVAVRNVRRDGMETLKKLEKNSDLSQDDQKNLSNEVQKITDLSIKIIDELLQNKTKEIMSI
jgi:ribosome recycling factor